VAVTLERPRNASRWTAWVAAALPMREVLVPFVVSRIAVVVLMAWGASPDLTDPTFGSLVSWDGGWYRQIAIDGYGPPPPDTGEPYTRWPFFPLLPWLGRGLSETGIPLSASLVIVSHVAFLLAVAGLWRLLRPTIGDAAARWGIWACCLFPFTVVFSMAYPSSLFLAGSVWSFALMRERRDGAAAAVAVVAAMSRPNGFIAVGALALGILMRDGWTTAGLRRAALVSAPAATAVLTWCALCWHWTGDPLVFFSTKDAWDELTIVEAVTEFPPGARPHLVCLVIGIAALFAGGRRLPLAWWVFTIAYLAPPMVLGVFGTGRYVVESFPVIAAGGVVLAKLPRALSLAAMAGSIVGLAMYAWLLPREYIP
jgi:hypothetical protein